MNGELLPIEWSDGWRSIDEKHSKPEGLGPGVAGADSLGRWLDSGLSGRVLA